MKNEAEETKPWGALLRDSHWLHLGILLAIYPVVHEVFKRGGSVGRFVYEQPILSITAFQDHEFPLALLLLFSPFLVFWRSLRWEQFEQYKQLRLLVAGLALVAAWAFAGIDINYYFNHFHLWDRLVLLTLAALVFVHPIALPPAILWAVLLAHQVDYPLGASETSDKRLLFQLLSLLYCAVALQIVFRVRFMTVIFAASVLVAANYYYAGVLKCLLSPNWTEWLTDNYVVNLVAGARANGWLSEFFETGVVPYSEVLAAANIIITGGTLLIEIGSAFWWIGRRTYAIIALLHIILHIGIFVTSGVFFWKWILINGLLLYCAQYLKATPSENPFSLMSTFVFTALVVASPLFLNPVRLGWFDSPISNFYKVEAHFADGRTKQIPSTFFAPYDIFFQQSKFYYLGGDAAVGTYGGMRDYNHLQKLSSVRSLEDLEALRPPDRRSAWQTKQTERFLEFVETYVRNFQTRPADERRWWKLTRFVRPPYHIYTTFADAQLGFDAPITLIEVVYYETIFTEGRIEELQRKVLHTITLDEAGG